MLRVPTIISKFSYHLKSGNTLCNLDVPLYVVFCISGFALLTYLGLIVNLSNYHVCDDYSKNSKTYLLEMMYLHL